MILAAQAPTGGDTFSLILPIAMIVLLGFVLWRGNRQRKQQQEQMKSQRVVGAEVLTQSGVFGTIVDIDDEKNVVTIESTPGTRLRVHSMTIASVVSDNQASVTSDTEASPDDEAPLEESVAPGAPADAAPAVDSDDIRPTDPDASTR